MKQDTSRWPFAGEPPVRGAPVAGLPKISVVTPSYNQAEFLERTMRSVLLQDYPALEYIVVDGGSTDASPGIIRRYAPQLAYWRSERDNGQPEAINHGFARATGDILCWLNSDDYFLPGALRTVAQFFAANPEAQVVVGTAHKLDRRGRIAYTPPGRNLTFEGLLNWTDEAHFMQPACFFRRQAWAAAGPLRTDLYFCFDVALWLKMAQQFRFHRIEDVLAHAQIHEGAKTVALRERMYVEHALMVGEFGGREQMRRELYRQADELAAAKRRLAWIDALTGWPARLPGAALFMRTLRRAWHRLRRRHA